MFAPPDPRRYRLAHPPLLQALAQVRFDMRARLASQAGVAPVQDALDPLFPYMHEEHQAQVTLTLGPAGVGEPQAATGQAWKFSDDSDWSLTLTSDVATLAVGSGYESGAEIAGRFQAVVTALASPAVGARRCTRLGLRYINFAEVPTSEANAGRSWFREAFTGWVGDDFVRADVTAMVNQAQLRAAPEGELSLFPADVQGIVRHGFLPPNTVIPGLPATTSEAPGYLLDIDLFVQTTQPMRADVLGEQFNALHAQIDRFFRWALTPEGEEHFGLEEVDE